MLAFRIASLRKACGMSQAQLAAHLNISASAVGMYEQNRRIPDLDTLVAIADIFDVSLDFLVTGYEHQYRHSKPESNVVDFPCSTCFWKHLREN